MNLARELKNLWNIVVTVMPIIINALGKRTGSTGNMGKNRDKSDDSIVENCQYSEKSHGDQRRFSFTKNSVNVHLLTLMLKKSKGKIITERSPNPSQKARPSVN